MNHLINIQTDPVAVLSTPAAIRYCGNDKELFTDLCENFGLVPVKESQTKYLWLVESINAALRMREVATNQK